MKHELPDAGMGARGAHTARDSDAPAIALLTPGMVEWQARSLLARSGSIVHVPTLVQARLEALQFDRILMSVPGLTAVAAGFPLQSGPANALRAAVAISALFILLAFWGFISNGMPLPVIGPMGRAAWWSMVLYVLDKVRTNSATTGAT